jgi:hypothetical protein
MRWLTLTGNDFGWVSVMSVRYLCPDQMSTLKKMSKTAKQSLTSLSLSG